jgi:hypothetical protein
MESFDDNGSVFYDERLIGRSIKADTAKDTVDAMANETLP